jgi:hypothetical protein
VVLRAKITTRQIKLTHVVIQEHVVIGRVFFDHANYVGPKTGREINMCFSIALVIAVAGMTLAGPVFLDDTSVKNYGRGLRSESNYNAQV